MSPQGGWLKIGSYALTDDGFTIKCSRTHGVMMVFFFLIPVHPSHVWELP